MRWFKSLALATLLTVLTCSTSFAEEYKDLAAYHENLGVVQCPKYLNIRRSAKPNAEVIGLIRNNGAVEVLMEGSTWCAVKSGNVTGYVMKEYLLLDEDAINKAKEVSTPKIKFTETGVIYESADVNSRVWLRPVSGTTYDVIEDTGVWVKIDLNGAFGYALSDGKFERFNGLPVATPTYNLDNLEGARKELVTYAMSFLGNPYVWGGNDPHTGADCSGFVRYVYKQLQPDIYLPRVSYQQCYSGEKIGSLEMRPGDLVFYANAAGTVHHVAMYIGNGTIIHAANKRDGVILSTWNYATPKFIRNILGD